MLRSPLVLAGDTTVSTAVERLAAHPRGAAVVVRRPVGLELYFHIFTVEGLLAELTGEGANDPLETVLRLDDRPPARTRDLAEPGAATDERFEGVLLDGVAIVGVRQPASAYVAGDGPADPFRTVEPAPSPFPESASESASDDAPTMQPAPSPFPPEAGAKPPSAAPEPASGSRGGFLSRLRRGGGRGPTRSAGVGGGDLAAAPSRLEAHPRLETEKDVLEPGERFDLTIGLAREAVGGVRGSMVAVDVPAGADHVDLDVQVVADEFAAPAGWYFRLRVPVAAPEQARIAVPLVAPGGAVTRHTLLEVHFSHRGVPAGVAFRRIVVRPAAQVAGPGEATGDGSRASPPRAGGVSWLGPAPAAELLLDPADPPPDLWITISKPDGNEATGRFVWSFQSPWPIELPREPLPMDLGDDARTFAARMIRLVAENEGTQLLDEALRGLGLQIRDKAPAELGPVLRRLHDAVRGASGRTPAILLQSAEAHVPWELALLEDPPDPERPPFLGAQFAVGRWLLGPRAVRVPPAREVPVRSMAVVVGDYKSSRRLRPLPQAEAEGEVLAGRWGAFRMAATAPELDRLLGGRLGRPPSPAAATSAGSTAAGQGGAEAIHFACHGEVDPNDAATGKVFLNDDQPLDPVHFLQASLGRTHEPFLFLNACQVGQAGESLGDYAGFAGSCLRNGFRGFVAPLWSVDDRIAHAIAVEFYERAFGVDGHAPTPVAEVLREIRGRFPADDEIPPSTWMAYVFYGNPRLVLRRE